VPVVGWTEIERHIRHLAPTGRRGRHALAQ
jgi:hypothetical protein